MGEVQKQRYTYTVDSEFVGVHVGTLKQFEEHCKTNGLVEGEPYDRPVSREDVNAERDRRTEEALPFENRLYDFDDKSKQNITGAATLANLAMMMGITASDTKWQYSTVESKLSGSEFNWIAKDNSVVVMDAQTVVAFGQAAAQWVSSHVFAGKSLKDRSPIPKDYKDDKYWP